MKLNGRIHSAQYVNKEDLPPHTRSWLQIQIRSAQQFLLKSSREYNMYAHCIMQNWSWTLACSGNSLDLMNVCTLHSWADILKTLRQDPFLCSKRMFIKYFGIHIASSFASLIVMFYAGRICSFRIPTKIWIQGQIQPLISLRFSALKLWRAPFETS